MFDFLSRLTRDIADVADVDLHDIDRAELGDALIQLRTVIRRLEALELTLTRAHDHRQAWKDDGAHSAKQWHRDRRGMTAGEAARQVNTARELVRLPDTARMVATGDISVDQASVAVRAVTGLPDADVAQLDTLMADTAPAANVTETRRTVTRFSHDVDPGSLEARERMAYERRGVRMGACADGGVWIEGRLDLLAGEAALTVTSALAAPKGDADSRTSEQRLADAVGDVFVRTLRWDPDIPAEGGRLPAVSIIVDRSTLEGERGAPAAELEHQGPVSCELARQLACDATTHRVIVGGRSEVLDVGRTQRVVTIAQRRALTVRDRGCVGCDAPPAWTDAHHVVFWADGGPTDLDNLVLLCRACHTGVHHGDGVSSDAPKGRGRWSGHEDRAPRRNAFVGRRPWPDTARSEPGHRIVAAHRVHRGALRAERSDLVGDAEDLTDNVVQPRRCDCSTSRSTAGRVGGRDRGAPRWLVVARDARPEDLTPTPTPVRRSTSARWCRQGS